MLNTTDFGLLRALISLQDPKSPLNVEDLAGKLGVSSAFVSQRLRRLGRAGYVERRQESSKVGRVVFYHPRAFYSVQWASPSEGVALVWSSKDEIDWAFPLVSQVPDEPARQAILKLLEALREKQLLDAWTKKSTVWKNVSHEFRGISIILYGSTARGEARPGADVDLLFVHDEPSAYLAEQAKEVADEVSLHAPRPLQVKHLTLHHLTELPERMRTSLRQDGLIIYDGLRTKRGGQTRQLWRIIYGGRTHDRS